MFDLRAANLTPLLIVVAVAARVVPRKRIRYSEPLYPSVVIGGDPRNCEQRHLAREQSEGAIYRA